MIPGGCVSKAVRLKLSQVFQHVSSEDEDEGEESDSTDDDVCKDVELKEALDKLKKNLGIFVTTKQGVRSSGKVVCRNLR